MIRNQLKPGIHPELRTRAGRRMVRNEVGWCFFDCAVIHFILLTAHQLDKPNEVVNATCRVKLSRTTETNFNAKSGTAVLR
jgi:hypothetical protein